MLSAARFLSNICLIFISSIFLYSCASKPDKIPAPEKDFCSLIHTNDAIRLSDAIRPLQQFMNEKTGVYVLEDGGGSLITRAWLTEAAEKKIDIQYFIFSTDNVGLIACDYLVRAADRGIKIRILVDDIMVDASPSELLTMDAHPNIEIKIYNPGMNIGKNIFQKLKKLSTDFHGANQRMHNKTFIVDGQVTITGGRNIADEYFDYDHTYNFRDRDVLLIGKAVKTVNSSFELFWNNDLSVPVSALVKDNEIGAPDATTFERLHQYACNPENFWPQIRNKIENISFVVDSIRKSDKLIWVDSLAFISDIPGKNTAASDLKGGYTTDTLSFLIRNARSSIDIQSPYFITTDEGKKLFRDAIIRGVKIRILTNSLASTDNIDAFSGYQRDRNELLTTGIRIFECKPDAKNRYEVMTGELQQKINYTPIFGLHAKTMLIDGKTTVIGTFNLDPRSANYNTECITIIQSVTLTQQVQKALDTDFNPENAWETTVLFNPDKYAGRKKRIKTLTRRLVPKGIL